MSNGAPPPVPGSAAPAKKGLSPLAWVGIGCGGLMVIGFVGFLAVSAFVVKKAKDGFQEFSENPVKVTAESVIKLNPDLELVETDDEAGTITFHNSKTGEEATLNFEDIAEGRFTVTTDEGEYSVDASGTDEGGVTFSGPDGEARFGATSDLSDVPDWVPAYPGATEQQGTFHSTSTDGMMGAVTSKTTDGPQQVLDYFKASFEDSGYEIGSQSMTTTGDGAFGAITGDLGEGRTLNVAIIGQGSETQVTINYNQSNQ